ncbi:MAG: zinc transporter ZntB [bacterium]|nr:zinc transporter ZntB [bacterium]MDT8365535.1 zinc transporter ZntB [bacterium]
MNIPELFNYSAEQTREWIKKESGLDEVYSEALLAEETRPRTTVIGDAVLLALREVNMNPGSDAEDMVSIRVWVEGDRIISTRNRKILSVSDIVDSLGKAKGPQKPGDLIVELACRMTSRMEDTIEEIEDRVAQLEERIVEGGSHAIRSEISAIRRESIMLRRYLAPQREAMQKLSSEKLSWLSENDYMRLREASDKLIRYIEDLDSVRDRASVTQEELVNRLSEQMNSRMYVLSVIAAIFLPLGFLTGLLGINLGGLPGAENNMAFLLFLIFLIAVVVVQVLYFKKKNWF